MKARLLVVDDDAETVRVLKELLEGEDYAVRTAGNGEEALAELQRAAPDLVLLDVRMPVMDGFELCKRMKASREWKSLPIIFLTSRQEDVNKVLGLELGGDDYVAKPYQPTELAARIKAVLRRVRGGEGASPILKSGALTVDADRHRVEIAKKILRLAPKEYELLCLLLERKRKVLSKTMILESVWGDGAADKATNTLETHVHRLRKRLGRHGDCIQTVGSVGYKWEDL